MDSGVQLVEYRRIALNDIPAEIMDVIQFRRIDEHVETLSAIFFQQVKKFRGGAAVKVPCQFQVQAVARAVSKDFEIVGHGYLRQTIKIIHYEITKA